MDSLPLENPDRRIGAPKNWDHTQTLCHTIEVWDRDGFMISAWQPTPAELKRLNEGCPLLLHISGHIHPVVALTVAGEPPKEMECKST